VVEVSHRHVYIANPAKLSYRYNQLVIQPRTEDGQPRQEYTIPIEDIRSVMLEDHRTVLTSALLSKLPELNVALYTCDDKHLPNGILLAYNQHSRSLKVMRSQLSLKKPFVKRIWQAIVQRKIENQASCLDFTGSHEAAKTLISLAHRVESGDRTNIEAYAAKLYFKQLYGAAFTRSSDEFVNAAMNYGYAIVRGQIARSLCAFGFNPVLGLHHHSELNSFNLADDLLEPFRPIVDYVVATELRGPSDVLEASDRHRLYEILAQRVLLEDEKFSMTAGIETMVASLATAVSDQSATLQMPRVSERSMVEAYE
jgi:CRISPR-associated protein Cas1